MNHRSIVLLALAGVAALTGCGGGSPTAPPPPTPIPNAQLAGSYTLTITASGACTTLPSLGRVTTYTANVTQTGTTIALNAAGTVGDMIVNSTTGSVSGNTVTLAVAITEARLNVFNFYSFGIAGSGSGTFDGRNVAGTINGQVAFGGSDLAVTNCNATDHRFTLARR